MVTTESLLDEMTDLERLATYPTAVYRSIQFSSYDRRSTSPSDSGWFSNEDGFGQEPIPGFEQVLKEPDSTGTGEYLICDVNGPGAILRLWTAGISGKIRLYLDDMNSPVYDGEAQPFFWNTVESLSGKKGEINSFRQFDATYFPVPFSKRCRIEWTGDLTKIHFYHVGIRIYESGTRVRTFRSSDIEACGDRIASLGKILESCRVAPAKFVSNGQKVKEIPAGTREVLCHIAGEKAIRSLSIKIDAEDIENALRKSILSLYFDNAQVPQVQAPAGDFFGTAPGLNPYHSLPFIVQPDGNMICRFVMPFKNSARIVIDNFSDEKIRISCTTESADFRWVDGKTMHFRARWKMDHGLTTAYFGAKDHDIPDMVYLMAMGKGRMVGAAAFIYNPSPAVTPWGNWWGEGDEKIFVDNDRFPSFFGTGSEDYFNYSWSSNRIFSYLYCGQPRNDGPGNRGYVDNFRWHISDDILFEEKLAFYMELGHHGIVPGFSYGRIVYYYALPGMLDDYQKISMQDIAEIRYDRWAPAAYLGSDGFRFIQAEEIAEKTSSAYREKGNLWAMEDILFWRPESRLEKLKFIIVSDKNLENTKIGLTMAHSPEGGTVSLALNGKSVKFDQQEIIDLSMPERTVLRNHFSEPVDLFKGINIMTFESQDSAPGKKIGFDFFWISEK
jgi:hypothetical protein